MLTFLSIGLVLVGFALAMILTGYRHRQDEHSPVVDPVFLIAYNLCGRLGYDIQGKYIVDKQGKIIAVINEDYDVQLVNRQPAGTKVPGREFLAKPDYRYWRQ